MKPILTILFLTQLLFSNHASAWVIKANFENNSVGDKAMLPNLDAFHDTAHNSKYSNSVVHSGSRSGSVTTIAGDKANGGFGKWGGAWKFPRKLKRGDEIWFRVWVYYPTGWSFNCDGCSEGMKFMRIHVASANGGNEGYHHNYINTGNNEGRLFIGGEVIGSDGKTIFENKTMDELRGKNSSGVVKVSLGQWHVYEQYVRFDSTPGKGIRRTWFDGNLIMEDKTTATLGASDSVSDFIYIWTYWNGGAPKTQTAYIDDVVITNEIPSNTDTSGNSFIGTGNAKFTARPKPPGILPEQ